MDIRIRLKVKNLLPSCEVSKVVPKTNVIELRQGHPTTVSVKYLFGEAKLAYNFLLVEES